MNPAERLALWNEDQMIIQELLNAGFVHVTGLGVVLQGQPKRPVSAKGGDFVVGKSGGIKTEDGITSVFTKNGFCFMGRSQDALSEEILKALSGKNVDPICAPKENLKIREILARIQDPLDDKFGDPFLGVKGGE